MAYKAILFDVDHTLGLDHGLEKHVLTGILQRLQDRHAAKHGHASPLIASIVEEVDPILKAVRAGPMRIIPGLATQFARVAETHQELDIDPERLAHDFCYRCLEEVPGRWESREGAKEILAWASERGLGVALVTNGWFRLQKAKALLLAYHGPLFVSEEMEAWKPSPASFLKPLEQLGVAPADALYVGDNPTGDVDGSHAVGMHAAWFDEGTPYNGTTAPEITITSLLQLRDAVDSRQPI